MTSLSLETEAHQLEAKEALRQLSDAQSKVTALEVELKTKSQEVTENAIRLEGKLGCAYLSTAMNCQ